MELFSGSKPTVRHYRQIVAAAEGQKILDSSFTSYSQSWFQYHKVQLHNLFLRKVKLVEWRRFYNSIFVTFYKSYIIIEHGKYNFPETWRLFNYFILYLMLKLYNYSEIYKSIIGEFIVLCFIM